MLGAGGGNSCWERDNLHLGANNAVWWCFSLHVKHRPQDNDTPYRWWMGCHYHP